MTPAFNSEKHEYRINGRVVPSVTQLIEAVLERQFAVDAWYLERGTAVHACAALIARGKDFACDERIKGYVAAVRKFFRDLKPLVIGEEMIVGSELYQYAGTLDLLAMINGVRVVVDYKNSLDTERTKLQLAGYAVALPSRIPANAGMGIELHEDGTYRSTGVVDLKLAKQEFLAMRTVYGIRERMGLNNRRKRMKIIGEMRDGFIMKEITDERVG